MERQDQGINAEQHGRVFLAIADEALSKMLRLSQIHGLYIQSLRLFYLI